MVVQSPPTQYAWRFFGECAALAATVQHLSEGLVMSLPDSVRRGARLLGAFAVGRNALLFGIAGASVAFVTPAVAQTPEGQGGWTTPAPSSLPPKDAPAAPPPSAPSASPPPSAAPPGASPPPYMYQEPLPPLPSDAPQAHPGARPPVYRPAPPGYYPPPPNYYEPPPPPPPSHRSPANTLWLGARVGALFPFGHVYDYDPYYNQGVAWDDSASAGPSMELDLGGRFGRHYIVYGAWERGWLGTGRDPSFRAGGVLDTTGGYGEQKSAVTDLGRSRLPMDVQSESHRALDRPRHRLPLVQREVGLRNRVRLRRVRRLSVGLRSGHSSQSRFGDFPAALTFERHVLAARRSLSRPALTAPRVLLRLPRHAFAQPRRALRRGRGKLSSTRQARSFLQTSLEQGGKGRA